MRQSLQTINKNTWLVGDLASHPDRNSVASSVLKSELASFLIFRMKTFHVDKIYQTSMQYLGG